MFVQVDGRRARERFNAELVLRNGRRVALGVLTPRDGGVGRVIPDAVREVAAVRIVGDGALQATFRRR